MVIEFSNLAEPFLLKITYTCTIVVKYIYNPLHGYRLNKICERITYLMCFILLLEFIIIVIRSLLQVSILLVLVSVLNYVINSLP